MDETVHSLYERRTNVHMVQCWVSGHACGSDVSAVEWSAGAWHGVDVGACGSDVLQVFDIRRIGTMI